MLPLVVLLALSDGGLAVGDTWSVERTSRFINEAASIDVANVERIDYRVETVSAEGFSIQSSRVLTETRFGRDRVPPPTDVPARERKLTFAPGGAPTFEEDREDAVRARLDRMMWPAAEDRKGVSWTRKFAASAALPAGKTVVKPTSVKGEDRTVSISYTEEGGVKGEGTAVISGPKRIVTSLKVTLRSVRLPSGDRPVTAVINQAILKS